MTTAALNQIIRHVVVDRTRTPNMMLMSMRQRKFVDERVVKLMPNGCKSGYKNGQRIEVILSLFGRLMTETELEEELTGMGQIAADPYSLGAVNEDDPALSEKISNGTQWRGRRGEWCFMRFGIWKNFGNCIVVDRERPDWNDRRWIAGIRAVA